MFAKLFELKEGHQILYKVVQAPEEDYSEKEPLCLQISTRYDGVFIDAIIGPMIVDQAYGFLDSVTEETAKDDFEQLIATLSS